MTDNIDVRRLEPSNLRLIADIDRSELIERGYSVANGELVARPVNWDIPTFDPNGTGDHSVQQQIDHWRPVVDRGAALLGAFDRERLVGLAIVDPVFEPGMTWLAFLHVTRSARRSGVATKLWNEAARLGSRAGSMSMYVSAAPSGSAVGFYLSRGCKLVETPHPDLFAAEPEDIHFVCPIGP